MVSINRYTKRNCLYKFKVVLTAINTELTPSSLGRCVSCLHVLTLDLLAFLPLRKLFLQYYLLLSLLNISLIFFKTVK